MSRNYFESIIARKFAGLAIRFQHIEGLYIARQTGAAGIAPCLQSNSAREENEYVGPGIGNQNRGLAAGTVGR